MIAALIVAGLMAAASGDVGARLAEASAAAQSLRGPLEGAWILRDDKGRALFALQIADPVDAPIGGAWRDLGVAGGMGVMGARSRGGGIARLMLSADGAQGVRLILRLERRGLWRGRMIAGGHSTPVTLARD